jgi:elongation factor Ts
VEGRSTAQGLIGVQIAGGKSAAMVELNCETDFVAKNGNFLTLLKEVTALNLTAAKDLVTSTPDQDVVTVQHLNSTEVGKISHTADKTLADLIALNIGQIGENITVRKSTLFR